MSETGEERASERAREPVELPDREAVASAVHDPARLAALRATELLDTGGEESFDRLTRLASELLDAPVSLVSLVDEERQYFKSAFCSEIGTALAENPCSLANRSVNPAPFARE